MAYYVYILASRKYGTLYIGVTSDLVRRVHEHKTKVVPGFTKRYGVDKLVLFEIFDDPASAIAREKESKKWRRISTAVSPIEACGYGFRARGFAAPRNDKLKNLALPPCNPNLLRLLARSFARPWVRAL